VKKKQHRPAPTQPVKADPHLCKICLRDNGKAKDGPGEAREAITFNSQAEYVAHTHSEHRD
jgi:hypothetical protein